MALAVFLAPAGWKVAWVTVDVDVKFATPNTDTEIEYTPVFGSCVQLPDGVLRTYELGSDVLSALLENPDPVEPVDQELGRSIQVPIEVPVILDKTGFAD